MARWDKWFDATTKPPFGAILNPDSPMNRGNVGCWLFNEGAGGIGVWKPQGLYVSNSGILKKAPDVSLSGLTVTLLGTTGTVTMYNYWASKSIYNTTAGWIFGIDGTATSVYFNRRVADGPGRAEAASAVASNERGMWCGQVTPDNKANVWKNGVCLATGTAVAWIASSVDMYIGGRHQNDGSSSVKDTAQFTYELLRVDPRALSASELLALYREPYGLDQYLVPGIPVFYSMPSAAVCIAALAARNQRIIDGSPFGGMMI